MGIEPTRLAWKARALPLSYTRRLVKILSSFHVVDFITAASLLQGLKQVVVNRKTLLELRGEG